MTEDRFETHVLVELDGRRRAIHFQEWWVRHRAALPAEAFVYVGADTAQPGPGVLEAIAAADVVVLPPSNPVVSIGTVLQLPGVREALAAKTVVGLSPIVGGAPVRGMADRCLAAIGVETSARPSAGTTARARPAACSTAGSSTPPTRARRCPGVEVRAVPLLMHDVDAAAAMARAALDLAGA